MDLSHVILAYAQTYTVTRRTASSYDSGGVLVPGSTSTLSVQGVPQPLSGRDLKRLPEGMRAQELLAFWTPTQLQTAGGSNEPDSIQIGADHWEVTRVDGWGTLGGYCKAILTKVGRQ